MKSEHNGAAELDAVADVVGCAGVGGGGFGEAGAAACDVVESTGASLVPSVAGACSVVALAFGVLGVVGFTFALGSAVVVEVGVGDARVGGV